jgi:hypothetical protein
MKANGLLFALDKSPKNIFGVLEMIFKSPMEADGVLLAAAKCSGRFFEPF